MHQLLLISDANSQIIVLLLMHCELLIKKNNTDTYISWDIENWQWLFSFWHVLFTIKTMFWSMHHLLLNGVNGNFNPGTVCNNRGLRPRWHQNKKKHDRLRLLETSKIGNDSLVFDMYYLLSKRCFDLCIIYCSLV